MWWLGQKCLFQQYIVNHFIWKFISQSQQIIKTLTVNALQFYIYKVLIQIFNLLSPTNQIGGHLS